jgi:hypothetical protein
MLKMKLVVREIQTEFVPITWIHSSPWRITEDNDLRTCDVRLADSRSVGVDLHNHFWDMHLLQF